MGISHKQIVKQIEDLIGLHIGDTVYLILNYCGRPLCTTEDVITRIVISSQNIFVETRSNKSYNKHFRLGDTAFLTKEECQTAYKQKGGK